MMYAAKLMMQKNNLRYVTDGLIKKVENAAFGSPAVVLDIKSGVNGYTYCGTIPNLLNKTVVSVVPYTLDIFIYSNGKISWRNCRTNGGIIPATDRPVIEDNGIQAYIAATLYFPTGSSQEVSFDFEGVTINTSAVSVSSGNYDYTSTIVGTGAEAIDLGLVYNRVLTPEELAQNYQVFLAKHRQGV